MSVKLEVTEEAKHQVQELIRAQKGSVAVRVFVQPGAGSGGGCGSGGCGCGDGGGGGASGPTFGLAFDRQRNGDEVVKVDGFNIVVDPLSAPEVDGARIDYVQGLDASGFTVVSPNRPAAPPVGSGCGCGSGGCGSGGGGCC